MHLDVRIWGRQVTNISQAPRCPSCCQGPLRLEARRGEDQGGRRCCGACCLENLRVLLSVLLRRMFGDSGFFFQRYGTTITTDMRGKLSAWSGLASFQGGSPTVYRLVDSIGGILRLIQEYMPNLISRRILLCDAYKHSTLNVKKPVIPYA